jgi:hypothetical protein
MLSHRAPDEQDNALVLCWRSLILCLQNPFFDVCGMWTYRERAPKRSDSGVPLSVDVGDRCLGRSSKLRNSIVDGVNCGTGRHCNCTIGSECLRKAMMMDHALVIAWSRSSSRYNNSG